MSVYYADDLVTLHLGDCLDVLPTIADASVDAVVTDPPYELGFMGKTWDSTGIAYNVEVWRECWRVLKPGGHLAAFGGTRTYHRMTVAIEDAGFEIRDSLHWIFGSGMPKGQNISKAIDKAAGAEREVVGHCAPPNGKTWNLTADASVAGYESGFGRRSDSLTVTAPATEQAQRWNGWNTQLKPGHEPIVLARKSTGYETTAANVLLHGTGALNVDACRTQAGEDYREKCASVVGIGSPRNGDTLGEWTGVREDSAHTAGRWPANVLLAHQPLIDEHGEVVGDACVDGCVLGCPVAEMDRQSGSAGGSRGTRRNAALAGSVLGRQTERVSLGYEDHGGASRFFPVFRYEAKAPASERPRLADGTAHTTVKPLALMQWLVRLITPPGGLVLDPFAGSGTTLEATVTEGFRAVGVEREPQYAELCVQRLSKPLETALFGLDP